MMFLNTLKVTFNNANIMWKVLLYHLICLILVCGVTVAVCYPVIVNLSNAGFFADTVDLLGQSVFNFRLDQIFVALAQSIDNFVGLISADIGFYLPYIIVAAALFLVLGEFLAALAEIPTKECLAGYMSSWSRLGFMGCFIKNLGKSVRYSLSRLLIVLPFDLAIFAGIYGLLQLYQLGTAFTIVMPFFVILGVMLMFALRQILFGGWACSIVVKGKGIFDALGDGVVSYAKAFGKVYGIYMCIVLIIVAVSMLAIMLTASVGLIVTIPLCLILMYSFSLVAYFYTNGLKFYIDKNKIISPRKIEDFESIDTLKDII